MDEAPLRRSFLADHRPRLPGGQPPRWSGRPRGSWSRSPAGSARSASTAQVSGVEIPGPTRSASDRLDMRPGRPVAQSALPLAPLRRFHRSLRDDALSA
jgi:hypothetical protein